MLIAFYELSGMRVKLRFLAKRALAGQIRNLTKMTRAFVLLAIEGKVFIQYLLCGHTS